MRFLCCRTRSERRASAEFNAIEGAVKHKLSVDEVHAFIAKHAELWAMLSVNLGIDEERCKQIATDVAFQIACGEGSGAKSRNSARNSARDSARIHHHDRRPR